MGILSRFKSLFSLRGAEGQWRGPFSGRGELGGSYLIDPIGDGWQNNLRVPAFEIRHVSVVYACVQLYARALSQCTPRHLVAGNPNDWQPSTTSPASRIFHRPNDYQTFAQLILNTAAEMLYAGEAIWFAVLDDRYAIQSVHHVYHGRWQVMIDPETRAIFYAVNLSANDPAAPPDMMIPARNVAHFRQFCPRNPLIGESPLCAAGLAAGLNVSLQRSQLNFFAQAARPSGVLMTEQPLTAEQALQLRNRFEQQSKEMAQGGVPVLSAGLKYEALGIAANDAQLIEQQKLSALEIARVYGVPMALISDSAGPAGGTEALIAHWLSVGLGSMIESIERTLDRLFQFDQKNRVDLDPSPLLRVDFQARIEGLVKSVQGGIMVPDEARAREGLGPVAGGDKAYLQQQMVPMDLLTEIHLAKLASLTAPPPAPAPEPEPPTDDDPDADETDDDTGADVDPEVARALVIQMREMKKRAA